jgi:hypothetical protein
MPTCRSGDFARPGRSVRKILLPLLGLSTAIYAQIVTLPSPQTGTVDGDVTDTVLHDPISGARVKLQAGERVLFTRCDATGRFQFQEVPLGDYAVSADQPGYLAASQLVRARLSADRTRIEVHLSLRPAAVIAGKVTDSAGVPMEGVAIDLLTLPMPPSRTVPGTRHLVAVASASTNDLGEYRFARLSPGSYYLIAHPRPHFDDTDETERITYYPRALHAASAKPVAVAVGQELPNIDIQLIRQAGVRISGRVVQPADAPRSRPFLVNTDVFARLQDASQPDDARLPVSVVNGAFELQNFLPGQYVVEAVTRDQADFGHPRILLAGYRTVEVGEKDIDGVEIAMKPPFDIQGAVVFDEHCPAVPVSIRAEVSSRFATMPPPVTSAASGEFTLPSLIPGRYKLAIRPQPAVTTANFQYSVASAKLGEREISQNGFELTGQPAGVLHIFMACSAKPAPREVVR